jgi:hypothetical protein
MNWFENELQNNLSVEIETGSILVEKGTKWAFVQIARRFPINYGRIDWANVPNSVGRSERNREKELSAFIEFFEEMTASYQLSKEMLYIGESIDIGLFLNKMTLSSVLSRVLEFPQHHFITNLETDWCLSLSMEGDMGFGFATKD